MSENGGELKGKHRKLGAFYIKDGLVADHLIPGTGSMVAQIFGSRRVNVSTGYPSEKYGEKDRVTVSEPVEVTEQINTRVACTSPRNTITIRNEDKILDKYHADIPGTVEGEIRCPNQGCITNSEGEGSPLKVYHAEEDGVHMFTCHYCETRFDHAAVLEKKLLTYLG